MAFLSKKQLDAFERRIAGLIEWCVSKGFLWLIILSEVRRKPVHTYELAKILRRKYGFRPNLATLYITTSLMRATGLIVAKQGEGRRKVLYLTPKGLEALERGISQIRYLFDRLRIAPAPTARKVIEK